MVIICSQVPLFLFAFTWEREGICNLINGSDNIDPEFILHKVENRIEQDNTYKLEQNQKTTLQWRYQILHHQLKIINKAIRTIMEMEEKPGFPGVQNKHSKAKCPHSLTHTPLGGVKPLKYKHRASRQCKL